MKMKINFDIPQEIIFVFLGFFFGALLGWGGLLLFVIIYLFFRFLLFLLDYKGDSEF